MAAMDEQTIRQRNAKAPSEDEIPEEVKEYKKKLERQTGKKYRYRTPKKDMPSIQDLLKHGHGEPTDGKDEIAYLAVLVGLFVFTLYMFHNFVSPLM